MRSNFTLRGSGWRGDDYVGKWCVRRESSKPPGFPFAEIILYAPVARFSEKAPGLPARAGHHGHPRKLSVCVLRPIAATERLHKSDNFAALLESGVDERQIDQVR